MEIIALCPGNIATGGTEGIHKLIKELRLCGADAKILYLNGSQPKEFAGYDCPWISEFPANYTGVFIAPEVYANSITNPEYRRCTVAVLWQGVDVYKWHNPKSTWGHFLSRTDAVHITMSEYGIDYLRGLGLNPIKIPDCLNDDFLRDFPDTYERGNAVLYNPIECKLTWFQREVMARCTDIEFKPLSGYSRGELIDLMRHSKLYIDFGVFSGRERLPRESVMCGCCILTSDKGTAGYYRDNSIPDKYKLDDVDSAVKRIHHVLKEYEACKPDFDCYRELLKRDKEIYPGLCMILYHEFTKIQRHNTGV